MENKYTFQHVAQQMIDLQDKKNKDYGNAYFENLDEEDLAAARIAIGNKWRRFKNLSKQGKAEIDETICISCGSCRATCPVEAPAEE